MKFRTVLLGVLVVFMLTTVSLPLTSYSAPPAGNAKCPADQRDGKIVSAGPQRNIDKLLGSEPCYGSSATAGPTESPYPDCRKKCVCKYDKAAAKNIGSSCHKVYPPGDPGAGGTGSFKAVICDTDSCQDACDAHFSAQSGSSSWGGLKGVPASFECDDIPTAKAVPPCCGGSSGGSSSGGSSSGGVPN